MSFISKVQVLNKQIFTTISDFIQIQLLGQGSFGTVHLYQHKQTQLLYAVKIIYSSSITNPYEQLGLEREIKVHFQSIHTNIVTLYDCFYENDNIYLIMEYLPNGNLFQYIQAHQSLNESTAIAIFTQVISAINYLHQSNVFHRDIKPENILLDSNNNAKICDFGWCAEDIHLKRKTFCGTYEYMAPEIILEEPYDYSIDLWSLGILLYEMLHGQAPFRGKDFNQISEQIVKGEYSIKPSISEGVAKIINGLIQQDASKRLQLSGILKPAKFRQVSSALSITTEESDFNSQRENKNDSQSYRSPKCHMKVKSRFKSPINRFKYKEFQTEPNQQPMPSFSQRKESCFQSPQPKRKPLQDKTNMKNNEQGIQISMINLSQNKSPSRSIFSKKISQSKLSNSNGKQMKFRKQQKNPKVIKMSLY